MLLALITICLVYRTASTVRELPQSYHNPIISNDAAINSVHVNTVYDSGNKRQKELSVPYFFFQRSDFLCLADATGGVERFKKSKPLSSLLLPALSEALWITVTQKWVISLAADILLIQPEAACLFISFYPEKAWRFSTTPWLIKNHSSSSAKLGETKLQKDTETLFNCALTVAGRGRSTNL